MICHPCTIQRHEECRYPENCPCQHRPTTPETPIRKDSNGRDRDNGV